MSHTPQLPSNTFFVRVRDLGRYVLEAGGGGITNPEECSAFINANLKQIFAGVKNAYQAHRRGVVILESQDGGKSVDVSYTVPTPGLLHRFGLEWILVYSRYDPAAQMIVATLDPATRKVALSLCNVPEAER